MFLLIPAFAAILFLDNCEFVYNKQNYWLTQWRATLIHPSNNDQSMVFSAKLQISSTLLKLLNNIKNFWVGYKQKSQQELAKLTPLWRVKKSCNETLRWLLLTSWMFSRILFFQTKILRWSLKRLIFEKLLQKGGRSDKIYTTYILLYSSLLNKLGFCKNEFSCTPTENLKINQFIFIKPRKLFQNDTTQR